MRFETGARNEPMNSRSEFIFLRKFVSAMRKRYPPRASLKSHISLASQSEDGVNPAPVSNLISPSPHSLKTGSIPRQSQMSYLPHLTV
jgi:hypothetical protein